MDRRSRSEPAEAFTPQYTFPDWWSFLEFGSGREVHRFFLGFHPRERFFWCFFFFLFLFLLIWLHLNITVGCPILVIDFFDFIFIVFLLFFYTWLKDGKRFTDEFP
jgi:hypothetical protein